VPAGLLARRLDVGRNPDSLLAHRRRDGRGRGDIPTDLGEHEPSPPHAGWPTSNSHPGPWCDTGFHTYTARWEPGQITFLIDGQQTATYSGTDAEAKGYNWPFDTAGNTQRVIVDLQMGGAVGAVDTSTLPVTMKIDYIPRWVLVTLSA
jgi:hypothetical protein